MDAVQYDLGHWTNVDVGVHMKPLCCNPPSIRCGEKGDNLRVRNTNVVEGSNVGSAILSGEFDGRLAKTSRLFSFRTSSPFSQYILPYFARASLRQLLHHLHFPRNHEPAYPVMVPRPFNYLFALQLLSSLCCDESFRALTPMGVSHCYNGYLEDVWMRCK